MRLKSNHENSFLTSIEISPKMVYIGVLLFLLAFVIVILPSSFATMQPVKSVEMFSEKSSHQNGEAGAWKVTKSATFLNRDEAEISLDIDSIEKRNNIDMDVVFLLDTSSYMKMNDKLDELKEVLARVVNNLSDESRTALITFNSQSEILSNLTSNKQDFVNNLQSIEGTGSRNYYKALVNLDNILREYNKEANRNFKAIFITSGKPVVDTPNEVSFYKYLKHKYSYLSMDAIQYSWVGEVDESLKNISDLQYSLERITLEEKLYDILNSLEVYENYKILDFINTDYFRVEKSNDVSTTKGNTSVDLEKQIVDWSIDNLKTGQRAQMKIKVKLIDESLEEDFVYSVGKKTNIVSKLSSLNTSEDVTSNLTPEIKNKFNVTYDDNLPEDCNSGNISGTSKHYAFDTVGLSENVPKCEGYQFKGWKITNSDVVKLNKDYFIMPEEDVNIKGTWSKLKINKSMNGTVKVAHTLYRQVEQDVGIASKYAKKYTGSTSGFKGNENIYYYDYANSSNQARNNNVIFANYCWRIVRTTDTGGVKIMYNGTPSNGKCRSIDSSVSNYVLSGSQMSWSKDYVTFNSNHNSVVDVGYMYNERKTSQVFFPNGNVLMGNSFKYENGTYTLINTKSVNLKTNGVYSELSNYHYTCFNTSGSCSTLSYVYRGSTILANYYSLVGGQSIQDLFEDLLHGSNANKYSSSIKNAVDNWYRNNMVGYTSYLEDTVWCNDRSIQSWGPYNPNGGAMGSIMYFRSNGPTGDLTCPYDKDRFSVNPENGNGALTYPVGLLTLQERVLYDLHQTNGETFWTMSPARLDSEISVNFQVIPSNGAYTSATVSTDNDYSRVKPVVSLRPEIEYTAGDGSANNPYIIAMD